MLPRIGIIAGRGLLPFSIADSYTKQGGDCYIALLHGEADLKLIENFKCKVFKIGMVGAVIEFFRACGVKKLIFAGGINRPNLLSISVDRIGRGLLLRVLKQRILGDDKILRIVVDFFEEQGFEVISSDEIFKNEDIKNEVITVTTLDPSASDMIDIELGIKVLKSLSDMDVRQSVITQDKYVLGIEAAEGTDNLISRCASLRQIAPGGVLIKIMKLNQDRRMDIPTIGPDTILNLAKYNYNGIAIEDKVIVIDQGLTVKLANKHKIFIVKAKC